MPNSQAIGAQHERALSELLAQWGLAFQRKKRVRTVHGTSLDLDFWVPAAPCRPPVVIECKTFGVEAKSPADSARRKTQEALWLLRQVRRYCDETRMARIVIVTGERQFTPQQAALLEAELQPDVHIVSINAAEALRAALTAHDDPAAGPKHGDCPLCGSPLSIQPGARPLGETAEAFEDCERICRTCDIGLSNARRPTYIRRRWEDGLWRRHTAGRLRKVVGSSLNVTARAKKLHRLAHERSEDLLTWNVFSWLEDSAALSRACVTLGLTPSPTSTRIFYWGTNDRYSFPCPLDTLLQQRFSEVPTSMSEPDVMLVTETTIVVIEAKLGSPNDRQPGRNMTHYLSGSPGWFASDTEVQAAGYYELTRNWAMGAALAERLQKSFALVHLVRQQDEVDIERTFGKLVTARGVFKRATWEDFVPACEPSLGMHLRDQTLYFEPAFPSLAVRRR
jgi:hypothetical protein